MTNEKLFIFFLILLLTVSITRASAEEKTSDSLERLGQCYEDRLSECAKCFPTGRDHAPFTDTVEKYRIGAEGGSTLPQLLLGGLYAQGQDVKKDDAEAYFWLTLAADRGDTCGAALREEAKKHLTPEQNSAVQKRLLKWSQEDLGLCWNNRISPTGMGGSYEEAAKRYREKAEAIGDMAVADGPRMMLGSLYAKGLGVPQDYSEAYFWLSLADIGGDKCGAALLASVQKNLSSEQIFKVRTRILEQLFKEAKQGDGYAQLGASEFYENGWGVRQDYMEAYFWYKVASKFSEFLVNVLMKVPDTASGHLTEAQISEVEKRVKAWKQSNYVDVDGELHYMKTLKFESQKNRQIASFNEDMADTRNHSPITDAHVTTCTTVIDLPVGTAHGDHSYGGICSLEHKGGKAEQVMICNDEMVEDFKIEPVKAEAVDINTLGEFVAKNCFGGSSSLGFRSQEIK